MNSGTKGNKNSQPTVQRKYDIESTKRIFSYQGNGLNNLKRIYAVVLSVSLGELLRSLYESFQSGYAALPDQLIISGIIFSTVWVFYFQEDKLLDISFGSDPSDTFTLHEKQTEADINDPGETYLRLPDKWLPLPFFLQFVCVMSTLVMFVFLSLSDSHAVHVIKRRNFVFFYVILLLCGTLLSLVYRGVMFAVAAIEAKVEFYKIIDEFRLEIVGSASGGKEGADLKYLSKLAHSVAMSSNWLFVNGLASFLILSGIICSVNNGIVFDRCTKDGNYSKNLLAIFIISLARNYFDYMGTWPFLYINDIYFARKEVRCFTWIKLMVSSLGADKGSFWYQTWKLWWFALPLLVFSSNILLIAWNWNTLHDFFFVGKPLSHLCIK